MSQELTPEERRRIYEEEKVRLEAQQQLKDEAKKAKDEAKAKNARQGCLIGIIGIGVFTLIYLLAVSIGDSTQPHHLANTAIPQHSYAPADPTGSSPADATKGDKYVQITADAANIRVAAEVSAAVAGRAIKGDVFELIGEADSWYKIVMFSGDTRYVAKSVAKETKYEPVVPASEARRRELYKALGEAQDAAMAEADRKFPAATLSSVEAVNAYSAYTNVQDDMLELQVVHRFGVQTPISAKINVEGAQEEWWRQGR